MDNVKVGEDLVVIGGPCSVESEEQTLETAWKVKEGGGNMLRGGAFKPRTSPYSFQGLGIKGLRILEKAKKETGLPIVTEVLDPRDVSWVSEFADVLQVGTRNMQNFSLLKEVGKWMEINGEAIYGTKRWVTLREGPSQVEMKSTTHRKEHGFDLILTHEDFWFTTKDENVYVISLSKPEDNRALVKSLFDCNDQIKSIRLLGTNKRLEWETNDNKVVVELPGKKSDSFEHGFVLKVELK